MLQKNWNNICFSIFTKTKLIVTIDQLVINEKHNANFISKFYYNLKEKCIVKFAHKIISGNDLIQDYIASKYGVVSRVIERGGDHVENIDSSMLDHERFPFLKSRYALSNCSYTDKKHIYSLLKIFSKTQRLNLVLIGNWKDNRFVRKLKAEFGSCNHILLLDSKLNSYCNNLIRTNALCYIHLEGSSNSDKLIDAMSYGLPVLTYNDEINVNLTEGKANYFIDEDDLKSFLDTSSMEQLKKNAILMKEIASRRFKWKVIIKEYNVLIVDALELQTDVLSLKKKYLTTNDHLLLDFNAGHLKYQYLFYEKD